MFEFVSTSPPHNKATSRLADKRIAKENKFSAIELKLDAAKNFTHANKTSKSGLKRRPAKVRTQTSPPPVPSFRFYRDATVEEGSLVLTGGSARGTGNVLVHFGGRFWSICDDGWNLQAAKVACRSLGYPEALGHTSRGYFGWPTEEIGLDNVQCRGHETSLLDCQHEPLGAHNCDRREAAGVFCSPMLPAQRPQNIGGLYPNVLVTASSDFPVTDASTVKRRSVTTPTTPPRQTKPWRGTTRGGVDDQVMLQDNEVYQQSIHVDPSNNRHRHKPAEYKLQVAHGRNPKEGRVEIFIDGHWGVICSDHWTLLEARVACRQAGLGLAQSALQANFFGGENLTKLASGIHCDGEESTLAECYHETSGLGSVCPRRIMVAGVVCATALPDLVPNATLLEMSAYLHDQPLYYMQCAMEENCASSSAFELKNNRQDWHIYRRRLLRFSSSVWNFGTADFRPALRKEDWEWHLCHMHYHSMQIFAHYDVVDEDGNRVAEGHKASFCLEDVQCVPKVTKKYSCKGFGDQGITVGCADDYLHDIDCQWIDITDVKPGRYVLKVNINPNYSVAELEYNNNAAICDMYYSGVNVRVTNCTLGRG